MKQRKGPQKVANANRTKQIGREPFTAAEFFAGIGLMRVALEREKWKVIFANDIDPNKAAMYKQNWPDDPNFKECDIRDIDPEEVPACDLFTASFPCKNLSVAGRYEGIDGKDSSAFWVFTGLLKKLGTRRPQLVLLENVLGFLSSHGGRDLERALLSLNELGYAVDALILNASHWKPQSRVRLFVLAERSDGKDLVSTATVSTVRPEKLCAFINEHPGIRWNISSLPEPPEKTSDLAGIVETLPDDDSHWWNEDRARYFFNQLSPTHLEKAKKMIDSPAISYATAFRRMRNNRSTAELRTDGLAGCLRTPAGGSARQILFQAGNGAYKVRLLTGRECARLQGADDEFVIQGTVNRTLYGFGDAVCVDVVEWILRHAFPPHFRPSL